MNENTSNKDANNQNIPPGGGGTSKESKKNEDENIYSSTSEKLKKVVSGYQSQNTEMKEDEKFSDTEEKKENKNQIISSYINTKANEPHEFIIERPPRKIIIDRKQKVYGTINIETLLKQENMDFSIIKRPPRKVKINRAKKEYIINIETLLKQNDIDCLK